MRLRGWLTWLKRWQEFRQGLPRGDVVGENAAIASSPNHQPPPIFMQPVVERPLSRQESKLVTRHRLLQAAMAVLVELGREGLTTGSVTKRVGVAQPTFYVHFRDMDDLLREVAAEIVDRLRSALQEARAPLRESVDLVAASHEAFRLSLRATVKHADLLRIFLSEQYRPQSTLGACAQQWLSEMAADLQADMGQTPLAMGLPASKLRLVAEVVVGLILQMGLALADKRETDEDAVVDVLSRTAVALVASLHA
jgi:AcrR family transcriptional regulator